MKKVLALSDAKALFVGKLDEWESVSGGIPKNLITIGFPPYPGNVEVHTQHQWDDLIAKHAPAETLPDLEVDDILNEFFTQYYGAAAEPMKRLHLRIEEIYSDPNNYPEEVRTEDLGSHALKGKHETTRIYRVLGTS